MDAVGRLGAMPAQASGGPGQHAPTGATQARAFPFLYPAAEVPAAVPLRTRRGTRFDRLTWIAGQADLDAAGHVRNPGRADAQVDAAMAAIADAVGELGGRDRDVVKLVAFHTLPDQDGETELLRRVRTHVTGDVAPVISLVALPRLPHRDMQVLIKATAIDTRDGGPQPVAAEPRDHWPWPKGGEFSHGLRVGELVFVGAQAAKDRSGRVVHDGDIVAQAKLTVANIGRVLASLDCDLDDVVKLNTWYLGAGTDADWRRAAEVRSGAFRFPGPGATGVPVPRAYPDGAVIRQECFGLRGTDGARMPRALSWPLGHWDWPMRVSFQQGIKVGRLVILGGQYSMDERGLAVEPNDMVKQTGITLDFIGRILAGFGTRLEDLVEVTGFYRHDATGARTPLADATFGPRRVPVTEVPLGTMGLEGVTLEVEGFAIAPA